MNEEKFPMTYAVAIISHNASLVFNILEGIFGAAASIFIYKILRQRPKM